MQKQHDHAVHANCATAEIELDGVDLDVDYRYTAALPAPRAACPSDPAFCIPPEPEAVEILRVYSHDDISEIVDGVSWHAIEGKILAKEHGV